MADIDLAPVADAGKRNKFSREQVKHKALIAALCASDPDIQTKGFWKAVERLADELDYWDAPRKGQFRPDAHKVNRQTCELEIHEVVNTHDVSERKLIEMGWLWGDMDAEAPDWHPVLFVHREGFAPKRVDLRQWYYRALGYAA
jgi:hypothetical protein